jgi:hypothetical protein
MPFDPKLLAVLTTLRALSALAQNNPECLSTQCGSPHEEAGERFRLPLFAIAPTLRSTTRCGARSAGGG